MEVGDGIDLCSDTGRVDSVLTESEVEDKKIKEGIMVKMNENGKEKDSEEGTMNDVLQALLSDPISRDSRDRILQSTPVPRALPLHIPQLQFPSFSSSLSSHSSITHPLYGNGQSGAQYSEIDPALVLSALHPKSDCPTENGDESCRDYVTDVYTASTEVEVEAEAEGELDLRASVTSVTDQKVQTALGIISDAVEADRNRNILSPIPDGLEESQNIPCLESNTKVPEVKGVEGKVLTNKVTKKKDYEFEYEHEHPEVIDNEVNDNKDHTEDEVEEDEREGREQASRRTFTNEETKILSDAMSSLTIDQERREGRMHYNFPLLETAEEVVDEVEEVEEEEVMEEEVKRMIQALELTEFSTSRAEKNKSEKTKSNELDAKIVKSDVGQVMNNENIDTNNRKDIKLQHSSSCESEGNVSVVPLKARRGVENRIMDLDFSCQDEGNAKDKEEAIQDSQPLSKVGPLSSSMASRSYSSEYDRVGVHVDSEGRSEDNHDIGESSRPGTGRMKGIGTGTGTGTGQGSRPGTGMVRGQGQGQGSRPGTGQGQGMNTDQHERKQSPRPSSSARSGTASSPPSSSAQNDIKPQTVSRPLSRAGLGSGSGAGLGGGTGTLTSSGMRSLNQPDRIEHQLAVDSSTRSDDPGSARGNVRGSVSDFDGSYVKAQQLLSLLENSNKDTGRTSTSTRSNITVSQVGSQGRVGDGGVGVGISAQYARGVTKGDISSNPGQTPHSSSSRPATAADSLSNSQYGEEQQDGDGGASRRSEIKKVNRTNPRKGEEKERSGDEERDSVGVRERQRKRERERETLRSDLAECRVRIEDRRNAAMVSFPPLSCLLSLQCYLYFFSYLHHHYLFVNHNVINFCVTFLYKRTCLLLRSSDILDRHTVTYFCLCY
jgi:hypothetical protein